MTQQSSRCPSNPNVHVYRETREMRLMRLVHVLWNHLTPYQQADLGPGIVKEGMGWALPGVTVEAYDDDDWLTTDQLAFELGLTQSAIRNWRQRYGLTPVKGKYRWGDVKEIRRKHNLRQRDTRAG